MPYLNECTLIGNVGKKPEIRTTQNGKKVASFSVATSRNNKDGKEETTWHRIVAFEPKSKLVEQYVGKGDLLWVRGELAEDRFTGSDGTNWVRSEIILREIQFLTPKGSRGETAFEEDVTSDAAA